jgi:ribosomal protein L22
MEYQATAKYVRSSTRKVRLVADSIRKLTPARAIEMLALTPKQAA